MPTVKELRAMAKARGLKGYSRFKKAELIALLATVPKTPAPAPTFKKGPFLANFAEHVHMRNDGLSFISISEDFRICHAADAKLDLIRQTVWFGLSSDTCGRYVRTDAGWPANENIQWFKFKKGDRLGVHSLLYMDITTVQTLTALMRKYVKKHPESRGDLILWDGTTLIERAFPIENGTLSRDSVRAIDTRLARWLCAVLPSDVVGYFAPLIVNFHAELMICRPRSVLTAAAKKVLKMRKARAPSVQFKGDVMI